MTDITFNGGKAEGTVTVPSSKSHTHRAIILSALSGGECRISNPLISFDTLATADAVRSMSAVVDVKDDCIIVKSRKLHAPDRTIDVKNSGTTLRLMSGVAALFPSDTTLTGDESIQKRPMGPLLECLESCGAVCSSNNGKAPLSIKGPLTTDRI